MLHAYRLLPLALIFVAGVMLGTIQSFAGTTAGKGGKTVFVDVSKLGRKDHAVKNMTEQYQEFAKEGWTVTSSW